MRKEEKGEVGEGKRGMKRRVGAHSGRTETGEISPEQDMLVQNERYTKNLLSLGPRLLCFAVRSWNRSGRETAFLEQ